MMTIGGSMNMLRIWANDDDSVNILKNMGQVIVREAAASKGETFDKWSFVPKIYPIYPKYVISKIPNIYPGYTQYILYPRYPFMYPRYTQYI